MPGRDSVYDEDLPGGIQAVGPGSGDGEEGHEAEAPSTVPNSGASHNCVAATSGVLYFRENGVRLGQDVRKFAPHGGQRDYVQGALQKSC
jgi:hypothetical protein